MTFAIGFILGAVTASVACACWFAWFLSKMFGR